MAHHPASPTVKRSSGHPREGSREYVKQWGRTTFHILSVELGAEKASQLMANLAGTILHFPKLREVERWASEKKIVHSIDADPSPQNLKRLGDHFGIQARQIAKLYKQDTGTGVKERRQMIRAQKLERLGAEDGI